MKFKFWQIDAFTNSVFKGNPAAVFVLDQPIENELMQNIAIEMNLSETAFVLLRSGQNPLLRWFTTTCEIDLCGHGTLASAQVYFSEVNQTLNEVTFDTKFVGPLKVTKNKSLLTMDFPLRPGDEIEMHSIPDFVIQSLSNTKPVYARKSRDLMIVYADEKVILDMQPNFNALLNYKDFIIVTAPSNNLKYDFVSRFFCASNGISEDPVTGSAHCTLAPYWSKKLNKTKLSAYQASKRGGVLFLELQENRLNITGEAVTVINGNLRI